MVPRGFPWVQVIQFCRDKNRVPVPALSNEFRNSVASSVFIIVVLGSVHVGKPSFESGEDRFLRALLPSVARYRPPLQPRIIKFERSRDLPDPNPIQGMFFPLFRTNAFAAGEKDMTGCVAFAQEISLQSGGLYTATGLQVEVV